MAYFGLLVLANRAQDFCYWDTRRQEDRNDSLYQERQNFLCSVLRQRDEKKVWDISEKDGVYTLNAKRGKVQLDNKKHKIKPSNKDQTVTKKIKKHSMLFIIIHMNADVVLLYELSLLPTFQSILEKEQDETHRWTAIYYLDTSVAQAT